MEIITAPDTEALKAPVGRFVSVSFSSGSVLGASGFTKIESVSDGKVTLTTKGLPRVVSISLIEQIAVLSVIPPQGRRF